MDILWFPTFVTISWQKNLWGFLLRGVKAMEQGHYQEPGRCLAPLQAHEWDLCSPKQRYYVVYDLEWQWFFMAYMLKVHKLSLLVLLAWKNISMGNNRNWLVWQILDDLSIAMVCSRVCYYRPVLEWWRFLKTSQKKMTAHGWLMLVIGNILIVTDWLIE
jgi:hypothetical protein